MLLLAAMEVLVTTVAFIYGHMHCVVRARNRRISDLLTLFLCLSVGILLFFLFVMHPPCAANDDDTHTRALIVEVPLPAVNRPQRAPCALE